MDGDSNPKKDPTLLLHVMYDEDHAIKLTIREKSPVADSYHMFLLLEMMIQTPNLLVIDHCQC